MNAVIHHARQRGARHNNVRPTITTGKAAEGCGKTFFYPLARAANKWCSSASTSAGPSTVLAISSRSSWR